MIRDKHVRFYSESYQRMSNRKLVHAMCDDSEAYATTDGEEDDRKTDKTSDIDEHVSDDSN
jgi:hypothetical protein